MKTLPQDFVEMLASLPGHDKVAETLVSVESPASLRVNNSKTPPQLPEGAEPVPWEPDGYYLPARLQYTFMPELYDGRIYVQDASSMMIGEAVRRIVGKFDRPVIVLDACAAPGGKSISVLSAVSDSSFLLANEYDAGRCSALTENLQRRGDTNYAVSNVDARQLSRLGQIFDIVLADVPCSGEGMMRKNETAIAQWSRRLIDDCARLQLEIVESVWRTLRPGGYLVYSTCTFNTTENEDNCRRIVEQLGAESVDLGLTAFPGVSAGVDSSIACARMLPGNVRGEGQFVAVFRKPDDAVAEPLPRFRPPVKTVSLPFRLNGSFTGIEGRRGEIYAVRTEFAPLVNYLQSVVKVTVPGLQTAVPKGRDYVPAQPLATSLALAEQAFPAVEVDAPTAISYLRGEALRLPDDKPRGFVLITHRGSRLGFAKNIGNRANNLFPSAQRIRSQADRAYSAAEQNTI